MANRRIFQRSTLLGGLVAALALSGCTGVGVSSAPDSGSGSYQVWGLNEASSTLSGSDRSVVLNGDNTNGSKEFFTADGTWSAEGFVLDDTAATAVRALTGKLPERTGDPQCRRLVLVDDDLLARSAVAVVAPDEISADGPVVAAKLD
ncbi:hypothetical protein [Micromonospora sp. NPDC049679]|uniref:hypothetical protein n=1 Tax=Micromonospora sp. NPDC049679 TaxID=3155920 RepID=UPI00340F6252